MLWLVESDGSLGNPNEERLESSCAMTKERQRALPEVARALVTGPRPAWETAAESARAANARSEQVDGGLADACAELDAAEHVPTC